MYQGGGQLIQQMRVVDADHDAGSAGVGQQRLGRLGQHQGPVRVNRAQQWRESTQRQSPRRGRRHRPAGRRALLLGASQSFPGQTGLAHPGRSGQNHACRPVPAAGQVTDEMQLFGPTG